MGERHDLTPRAARLGRPRFRRRGLAPASGAATVTARRLVADPGPPVRVTQEIAPVERDPGRAPGGTSSTSARTCPAGCGSASTGPAGTCVRVRHGEVLAADGSLYTENLRTARQTDEFTHRRAARRSSSRGSPSTGSATPRSPAIPANRARLTSWPGWCTPTSRPPARSSAPSRWLDQLFRNIDWGQRGNFISVPTDCPQRDERLGWLGDAQIFARTACYNRDVAAFFAKWLDDVADAQLAIRAPSPTSRRG